MRVSGWVICVFPPTPAIESMQLRTTAFMPRDSSLDKDQPRFASSRTSRPGYSGMGASGLAPASGELLDALMCATRKGLRATTPAVAAAHQSFSSRCPNM